MSIEFLWHRGCARGVWWLCAPMAGGLLLAGCSQEVTPYAGQLPGESSTQQRVTLWEVGTPPQAPASQPVSATQPADTLVALSPPYRLDTESIVQLVYRKSPLVRSSRENMVAAQHGLAEFRANLSRFEPFLEADGDVTDFPKRRHSEGISGEATAGLEKETFDGAVLRLEGGMSGQRVVFGDVDEGQEAVEEGSGGLVRGRIEIPFAGSRKRQDRVINQAFQESSARKAALNYVSDYSSYVSSALSYYRSTLYYLGYMRTYQLLLAEIEKLMQDPRVKDEDRSRLESAGGDARVVIESYDQYYRTYLLYLLQYTGIMPDEGYTLAEPPAGEPSRYYEQTLTREGCEELLAEAYANNPRFRVLEDAIRDAELKREQAIEGKLGVTAFGQATSFGFGSETYDDRVGGWQVEAGTTLRLNDQRVLTASQKKAEAEIRGYRAQIEAQQLSVQQQIATESNTLRSRIESRPQILENTAKDRAQFEERRRKYLERDSDTITIDDVLTSLNLLNNSQCRLIDNLYYTALAENRLMAATGEVYRLVGMEMADDGNGVELAVKP